MINLRSSSLIPNLLFYFRILTGLIQGNRISIRVPHLYEDVVGSFILKLRTSKCVSFRFYDDGLLGCLRWPTAKQFYPATISNICRWDTACWTPPLDLKILSYYVVRLRQFELYARSQLLKIVDKISRTIVVEAKYMDYGLLNRVITRNLQSNPQELITYFQHPSVHKRNADWPSNIKRNIVTDIQCESWLLKNLSEQSHIFSAVTSSVLLACEFALQKMTSSFKLTLLIQPQRSPDGLSSFYNPSEAFDFANHILKTYSDVVDVDIADWN